MRLTLSSTVPHSRRKVRRLYILHYWQCQDVYLLVFYLILGVLSYGAGNFRGYLRQGFNNTCFPTSEEYLSFIVPHKETWNCSKATSHWDERERGSTPSVFLCVLVCMVATMVSVHVCAHARLCVSEYSYATVHFFFLNLFWRREHMTTEH